MRVRQARAIARQWVQVAGSQIPGLSGAFLTGSILWMDDHARLPPTSDVDVMLVVDAPPDLKLGKFRHQGVLLEVSYLARQELQTPQAVLASPHLAASFSRTTLLLDPTGRLAELQATVAEQFARPRWVRARVRNTEQLARRRLAALDAALPLHDQVSTWLFGASLTTQMLLLADLRNPTVRKRYVAARELLAAHGQSEFYEELLALLGCAHLDREQVETHLRAMTDAFDVARGVLVTPYRFAADLSAVGRPVAVDGSRELIHQGLHREAIFWLAATYSRCLHVLAVDASPEQQAECQIGYHRLLADLGVATLDARQRACRKCSRFLPRVRQMADAIMAANRDIQ